MRRKLRVDELNRALSKLPVWLARRTEKDNIGVGQ